MDLGDQALRGAAESFANAHGVKDSGELQRVVSERISALSKGMDLSPTELRRLAVLVLTNAKAVAAGTHTAEDTDSWSRASIHDLRTRHRSMARVNAIIHATNAWLKAKYPAIHAALHENGSLGSHPFIVRQLTDRYLKHEHAAELAARKSKWPGKAQADQAGADVAPGGLLSSHPPSSAYVQRVRALQASDPSAGPANLLYGA
jgi:hypothetical protein